MFSLIWVTTGVGACGKAAKGATPNAVMAEPASNVKTAALTRRG